MKNQWGWGGFTTHDLARCRLAARLLALFYDWWNIFVRLADPNAHREAITSRPLFLSAVATRTRHARQTTIRVASSHARARARGARARRRRRLPPRPRRKCGAVDPPAKLARHPLARLPGVPQRPPAARAARLAPALMQPKRGRNRARRALTAGFRLKTRPSFSQIRQGAGPAPPGGRRCFDVRAGQELITRKRYHCERSEAIHAQDSAFCFIAALLAMGLRHRRRVSADGAVLLATPHPAPSGPPSPLRGEGVTQPPAPAGFRIPPVSAASRGGASARSETSPSAARSGTGAPPPPPSGRPWSPGRAGA